MRSRIKLTGRKHLPISVLSVKLIETSAGKTKVILEINDNSLRNYPGSALKKLRLTENKFSETLNFGKLEHNKTIVETRNRKFTVPSCQFRLVATDESNNGKILASTKNWTLNKDNDGGNETKHEGILNFHSYNIKPLIWKLDIRDDDYPVVYVDDSIPNAHTWVRTDPIFIGCVFPEIIREVFRDMLMGEKNPDQDWENDWLDWANLFIRDKAPTDFGDAEKRKWIEDLIEAFCRKHALLKQVKAKLVVGE